MPFTSPRIAALVAALVLVAAASADDHPVVAAVKPQLKDTGKPFVLTVKMQVKDGVREKFEAAFAKAITETRKEKGNVAYELTRDAKDPNAYLLYEKWKTLADLEAHLKTPHITALLGEFKDFLAKDTELQVLLPVGD
jgi:quinol monooxygenase YgiN